MKPIRDYFFIKVEKKTEDTVIINGEEITIDTSYDPMKLARQYGVVVETPGALPDGIDLDIKEGDTVYCHHFLVEDENEVKFYKQELVYKIHWSDVYCRVRNGKLKMLYYWNLVEQKMEDENDFKTESGILLKPNMEEIELYGYIRHMNKEMKNMGVKEGDEVVFSKNSEYDMNIMGEKLMRMRNFDILAKIEK
jgi:co-chaperonin GroES (HSP10)